MTTKYESGQEENKRSVAGRSGLGISSSGGIVNEGEKWGDVTDGLQWYYNAENDKYNFRIIAEEDINQTYKKEIEGLQGIEKIERGWDRVAYVSIPPPVATEEYDDDVVGEEPETGVPDTSDTPEDDAPIVKFYSDEGDNFHYRILNAALLEKEYNEEQKVQIEKNEGESMSRKEWLKRAKELKIQGLFNIDIRDLDNASAWNNKEECTDSFVKTILDEKDEDFKMLSNKIEEILQINRIDFNLLDTVYRAFKPQLEEWDFKGVTTADRVLKKGKMLLVKEKGKYYSSNGAAEEMLNLLRMSVWKTVPLFFDSELGYKDKDNPVADLSLLRKKVTINNLNLYFSQNSSEQDMQRAIKVVETFIDKIRSINAPQLLEMLTINFNNYSKKALTSLVETTGINETKESISNTADKLVSSNEANKFNFAAYADTTVVRWQTLLKQTHFNIVFYKAGITNVFGLNGSVPVSTADFVENNLDAISGKQRLIINLSVDDENMLTTIAHELAHSLGYNPEGVNNSGHFGSIGEYLKEEAGYGPKILFDAYFFETLFNEMK
jgi:hypothetical protein